MSNDRVRKLGQIVKAIRKDQGLTQEQLAATTGVGIRFVRELENGKESCHIGKSLATISMLGIDIHLNGTKL